MPYFIDENECVRGGTKDAPGDVVKCHETHGEAVAHLQALYANVEDAKEVALPVGFFEYRQGDQDRWIAISTADEWDQDGEAFDKEAIDYAIQWAKETRDYPELRVIHIKGARVGQCDKMSRVGGYAVDEGYYFSDAFSKEAQRAVTTGKMSRVSRGFQVVEATGACPCGVRLRVSPFALKIDYQCPVCEGVFSGKELTGIRFTKARVFDLSITDRPAVRSTAIANFTVTKEQEQMTRDEIKKRLIDASFKEEVVVAWLEGLSDADLEKMKEDSLVQTFKEDVKKAAAAEEEAGDKYVELKDGFVTCTKCGTKMRLRAGQSEQKEIDFTPIFEAIKEAAPKLEGMEIEIPGIEGRLTKIEEMIGALTTEVKELNKSAVAVAKETLINEASPETLTRLRFRSRSLSEADEKRSKETEDKPITTGDGRAFNTLSEAFAITPVEG